MRGLAFPSNAVFDRETSYDYGTPSAKIDDIPIDPALSGPAMGPTIVEGENGMDGAPIQHVVPFPQPFGPLPRQYSQEPRQYSQGPQGDPFAPLPPPSHLPIEEEPRPTPKPVKRKRKPRREEECGFCQGNDSKNKDGQPEVMATCAECGRSGHPSCMQLGEVGGFIRSYPWKCIECKTCEICQEKGDDECILFCDFCDRGWHMYCIDPPIKESPPGRWHCPLCPQLDPDDIFFNTAQPEPLPEEHELPRASSVASSSRSKSYPAKATRNLMGKGKAVPMDESGLDEEEPETPTIVKTRGRPKSNKRINGRKEAEDELQSSPVRPTKRKRVRLNSPVAPLPRIRLRLSTGKGKERDEGEKGLFDDILSTGDRDTSKTTIEFGDKQRFERSRTAAEEKLAPSLPLPSSVPEVPVTPGPSSRPLRSSHVTLLSVPTPPPGLSASPPPPTPGPSSQPHALRIRTIRFGQFDIQTWYDAPFPEEYANTPDGRMWICEFCLKYMKSRFGAVRHRMKCKARHPPGDEIYRDGAVSIFEVDGRKNKIYCQNLCLLSKMFLDHKSLFYDVEPFLFYVVTEVDDVGARFVGYFSKEKRSPKDYNVSCIMTLPVRQRQGWGNLLIDFSYLLSKKEQRLGSPEKPLSGLGALGYKSYWALAVMRYLETAPDHPQLEDISAATSMTIEDVYTTLSQQNMIFMREVTSPPVRPSPGQSIKFPKGRKNGIARKHLHRTQTQEEENSKTPFVPPKEYDIHWEPGKVEEYLNTWKGKGYLKLNPEKLKWSPFLLARMQKKEGLEATASEMATSEEQMQRPMTMAPVNGKSTSDRDVAHSLFAEDDIMEEPRNAVTPPMNSTHAEELMEQDPQAPVPEDQELDVKSEDPGTPLTSLTSRQSVPSDDTIYLLDSNTHVETRGAGKETNNRIGGGSQDIEPVVQSGLVLVVGTTDVTMGGDEDADAEYEEDVDADGEYEEDAEAEPVNLPMIH